jgi:hypothetical protein
MGFGQKGFSLESEKNPDGPEDFRREFHPPTGGQKEKQVNPRSSFFPHG